MDALIIHRIGNWVERKRCSDVGDVGATIGRPAAQCNLFARTFGEYVLPAARAANGRPYKDKRFFRQLVLYLNFLPIFCLIFPETLRCQND